MIKKTILRIFVNVVVDRLILWPFLFPIIFGMKEVQREEKHKNNGISILALNSPRFRSDLEILSKAGFRIYKLPYKWQTRIFYAYQDKDINFGQTQTVHWFENPFLDTPSNSSIYKDRVRIRKYLSCLLSAIIKRKKINCIIGAGLFYNQDFDWGAAAEMSGCPYVVFHRENLIESKDAYLDSVKGARFLKKIGFSGTYIVFHNRKMKEIYDQYSGVLESKIFALGALRMDKFVTDAYSKKNLANNKRILLFSFPESDVISFNYFSRDFGWYELNKDVHTSFVELAIKYPEIEFVIKHKGVNWNKTKDLLENIGAFDLQNLKIYGNDYDAHKLIFKSDVITGFSTTALLETGITGKPIVYPLFAEASNPKYKDFLYFKDAPKMFSIANSKEHYKELIMKKYKDKIVSETKNRYRELRFESQVSSIKADSIDKYTNLLIDICN
jgi:hypothetical protein